jgi:hypothetical protein
MYASRDRDTYDIIAWCRKVGTCTVSLRGGADRSHHAQRLALARKSLLSLCVWSVKTSEMWYYRMYRSIEIMVNADIGTPLSPPSLQCAFSLRLRLTVNFLAQMPSAMVLAKKTYPEKASLLFLAPAWCTNFVAAIAAGTPHTTSTHTKHHPYSTRFPISNSTKSNCQRYQVLRPG